MSNVNIQDKIKSSISQICLFTEAECQNIEKCVDNLVDLGEKGALKPHTLDVVPLRKKFFFGEGYTYGGQMSKKGPGMERLYPVGYVDPIPAWIFYYVINPLVMANVIPKNFVNSVAINDYAPGGCIVSHIDPIHLFERPIISLSLFSDSALCFGCKFEYKPIRCSQPAYKLELPRGIITILSGFAANEITHCVRPIDTKYRRAVILLRRVKDNAPRLLPELPVLCAVVKPKFVDFTSKSDNKTAFGRKSENFVSPSEKIMQINKKQFKKYSKRGKKPTDIIAKQNIDAKVFFADNVRYSRFPYKL